MTNEEIVALEQNIEERIAFLRNVYDFSNELVEFGERVYHTVYKIRRFMNLCSLTFYVVQNMPSCDTGVAVFYQLDQSVSLEDERNCVLRFSMRMDGAFRVSVFALNPHVRDVLLAVLEKKKVLLVRVREDAGETRRLQREEQERLSKEYDLLSRAKDLKVSV